MMKRFDPGQLRIKRRRCGLLQSDVAKVLHVTSANVSNMENGRIRTSAEDLIALANLYGAKVEDFFVERLEVKNVKN